MKDLTNITSTLNSIDNADNIAMEEQSNQTLLANTVHLTEKFSLSDYEDDEDDSGFSCPCCLPR
ncbi:hypothetical protein [Pedobacter psychrodurus]|uniref:hypothetical protein n=1 Tax=Pedobacter psychrodurus TaxID=2530456 RepID=UPI00293020A2|nr:hypothetical protein [Pedobacter psychrodurus]